LIQICRPSPHPRRLSALTHLGLSHHAASGPSYVMQWGIVSSLAKVEVSFHPSVEGMEGVEGVEG